MSGPTGAERLRLAIPWDEYERCTESTARAEYERRVGKGPSP